MLFLPAGPWDRCDFEALADLQNKCKQTLLKKTLSEIGKSHYALEKLWICIE